MPLRAVFPGIWQIDLPWTNAWLLARGGDAVLVDTGTRWDRRAVIGGLRRAMPGGFRLHSILLTHAHCDHAGNAAYLAERYDAKLICHAAERPFIATRRTYVPHGVRALSPSGFLFGAGELVFPVKRRAPDLLIRDAQPIDSPIGPLRALETPGHTPGHVSYYHEAEGWLFSGDALINVVPWIRKVGLSLPVPIFTENMEEAAQSAWKIADLGPKALFAGHGRPHLDRTAEAIRAFVARAAPRS